MLSVIVVNFRSSDLIDDCVRSLLEGSRVPDEIVVVDNAGTDGGLAPALAERVPTTLVVHEDNPGYAAACNAGVKVAAGDVLLFLNADVRVGADALERCLRAMDADADVGVTTCRLVRPDGRLDHAAHRGLPTPVASFAYKLRVDQLAPDSRRLSRYRMAWLDPQTDHDIEACSGAFLMTRREVLEAAGGWDERYRFYAEDLDLCLRVGQCGYRVRYLGTVDSTHLKGAFSGIGDTSVRDPEREATRRWVQREIVASHRLFYEEHLRSGTLWPASLAIRTMFTLQRLRLDAADRLTRSASGP